ncbi:MAG: 2'-5' RNA ligase family protein [Acidimicrobiia bacterium]
MTTGHAIELLFDTDSERRIVHVWRAIGGGSDLEAVGGRPHLSLALIRPPGDPEVLATCVEKLSGKMKPMRLELSAVGAFPGDEGVVFLAPAVTSELVDAHAELHEILRECGVTADELYQPGRWVPHCTVALHVPPNEVPAAVEVVRGSAVFGPINVEGISLVEFLPVEVILSTRLGNEEA